jgi:hypothetical protein
MDGCAYEVNRETLSATEIGSEVDNTVEWSVEVDVL